MTNSFHVSTGEEDERECEVVRGEVERFHLVVKMKGKRVIMPSGGGCTEHDVEREVVWVRGYVGED